MVRRLKNLDEFRAFMKEAGDRLVVIDFTAEWCGPCKLMGPAFEQQATLAENSNVLFAKVDVDEADDVSAECQIQCMPTFQLFRNGNKVAEFSGANVKSLIEQIAKHREN